jgi:hypothetical protein
VCSHHGGVAKSRTRDRADKRVARIRCNDGTFSRTTGRGACSRHGGVADDGPINLDLLEPKPRTAEPRERGEPVQREARRGEPKARIRVPTPSLVVRCADGTISAKIGRGACSHHGGVVTEPDTAGHEVPAPDTRPDRPWWGSEEPKAGQPLARCVDGTLSYSKHHRGTCSNHGGVRDWLDD